MSATLVLILRLILAACLYAFLIWALLAVWRSLREQGLQLSARRTPSLDLTIHPEDGLATRRTFQSTEIIIGRDPVCDVTLEDNGISARHARLSFHHGQWWLEDLHSTNGTRLNQAPLQVPTVLVSGDQIECGRTALIVSIGASIESSPTLRIPSEQ